MITPAPIPAAIRFEYQAPEGATVRCPGCVSHPDPHDLQVVDVEVVWEPVVEAGRVAWFHYSFRLTGEDPSCEIITVRATEQWMHDAFSASYGVVTSLIQVRVPQPQSLWEVEG